MIPEQLLGCVTRPKYESAVYSTHREALPIVREGRETGGLGSGIEPHPPPLQGSVTCLYIVSSAGKTDKQTFLPELELQRGLN